jgi:phosphoribosylglycinamide formyltransferase-1
MAAISAGHVLGAVAVAVSDKKGAFGLERAARRGVPTLVVSPKGHSDRASHERAILEAIAPYEPRLAVLAGYMRLVTPVLLGHFYSDGRLGVLNVHPADTRAYQGTHGYEFAMGLAPGSPERLTETRITVHYVDEGMDTGPILAQVAVPVHPDDTLENLRARGLAVEHQILPRVVDEVVRGRVRLEGRELVRTRERA